MKENTVTNEELVLEAKRGNRNALEQLWSRNQGILYNLFARYFPLCRKYHCEQEDVIQCGYFVIIRAVDAYKPEKGTKFTSYLNFHVKNEVYELFCLRGKLRPAEVSGNAPVAGTEGMELLEGIEDTAAHEELAAVEQDNYLETLRRELERGLGQLPEQQEEILRRRYYKQESRGRIAQALKASIHGVTAGERKALWLLSKHPGLRQLRGDLGTVDLWYSSGLQAHRNGLGSTVERQAQTLRYLADELGWGN